MRREASGTPARVETAMACARGLATTPFTRVAPDGVAGRRWFLIGDPQTSVERLARYLHDAGLLGDDGHLARSVGLLSLGDHFDYAGDDAAVSEEGIAVLRWLAEHPPDQVVLLAGNHDLARVMELAAVDDARFAAARADARDRAMSDEAFAAAYPDLPVRGVVARDYSAFTVAQRELVTALLAQRRMVLAAHGVTREGAPLLLTHAGVTTRELATLRIPTARDPAVISERLCQRLDRAVDVAIPLWRTGRRAALNLAPLYVPGNATEEGGGMLYHRPANPDATPADARWAWSDERPRRFDPRALPEGLAQACGHTGHTRCLKELGPWISDDARDPTPGRARTLTRRGDDVRYELGIRPADPAAATLFLLDPEMTRGPERITVMEVASVTPPPASLTPGGGTPDAAPRRPGAARRRGR